MELVLTLTGDKHAVINDTGITESIFLAAFLTKSGKRIISEGGHFGSICALAGGRLETVNLPS